MIKCVSIRKLKDGVTPEQYEKYYWEKHIPLSGTIRGVRKVTVGLVRDWGTRPAPFYRMSEVYFDDYDALEKAIPSPEATPVDDPWLAALTGDVIRFIAEEEQIIP